MQILGLKGLKVNKYSSVAYCFKFGVHKKNIVLNNDSDKLTFYNNKFADNICSHVKCKDPGCAKPFKPEGSCCDICGKNNSYFFCF